MTYKTFSNKTRVISMLVVFLKVSSNASEKSVRKVMNRTKQQGLMKTKTLELSIIQLYSQ